MSDNDLERQQAISHWSAQDPNAFYESTQHWRRRVADVVAEYRPRRVLEFGCNVGQNLVEVLKRCPNTEVVGLDVNEGAIAAGRAKHNLDLRLGSDLDLAEFADDQFDVCFTVSVLDHLPAVEDALASLLRISSTAVCFLEPYSGDAIRADVSDESEQVRSAIPFTYLWDYPSLFAARDDWRWRWRYYPLGDENLAPHYWLIEGQIGGELPRGV